MPPLRWILLGLVFLASPASACQICLPMPTESLADRVLAAEPLVLAREHPDRPYQLVTIRTLKGDLSTVPPVDLFLDSSTRRQLSTNPDLSLLCGWSAEHGEWRRLALHDEAVAPVVATILDRAEAWESDPDARLRYFANFLGHEDSELSDLAHIEVARAPYAKLLPYADRIPREQLHEKLGNFRRMKWHALYILFLSQSEDPRDHAFLREGLADAARYGISVRTAAFATALIEIDRRDALARLRDLYGSDQTRRPEERKAILAALALHGEKEETGLRDPIVGLLGEFLGADPSLAPEIASTLARWKRDDLAEPIAALVRETPERFDTDGTLALRRYLRESSEYGDTAEIANPDPVVAETESADPGVGETRHPLFPLLAVVGLVLLAGVIGLLNRPSRQSATAPPPQA